MPTACTLGPIELIVRDVDDNGKVTGLGLSFEPVATSPRIPVFLSAGEIGDRLRRLLCTACASALPSRRPDEPMRQGESATVPTVESALPRGPIAAMISRLASTRARVKVRRAFQLIVSDEGGARWPLQDPRRIGDLTGKRVLVRVDLNVPMRTAR